MNGISALIAELRELPRPERPQREDAVYEPERGPHQMWNLPVPSPLLSASRTVRITYLLLTNHTDCAVGVEAAPTEKDSYILVYEGLVKDEQPHG